jgi:hypothetical protein
MLHVWLGSAHILPQTPAQAGAQGMLETLFYAFPPFHPNPPLLLLGFQGGCPASIHRAMVLVDGASGEAEPSRKG